MNLTLERKEGTIEFIIQDNGQGFDPDAALSIKDSEGGLGLIGMKERTHLSGGTFTIESVKGVGTTIHASWPVRDSREQVPGMFYGNPPDAESVI